MATKTTRLAAFMNATLPTSLNATLAASILASLAVLSWPAGAEPPAAPPVALPGTPGVAVSGLDLAERLKAALGKSADPAVAEVDVTDQYAIHEVRRLKASLLAHGLR